jgi:hypothetical protein
VSEQSSDEEVKEVQPKRNSKEDRSRNATASVKMAKSVELNSVLVKPIFDASD